MESGTGKIFQISGKAIARAYTDFHLDFISFCQNLEEISGNLHSGYDLNN
jgi:hypothetical protein